MQRAEAYYAYGDGAGLMEEDSSQIKEVGGLQAPLGEGSPILFGLYHDLIPNPNLEANVVSTPEGASGS